MSAVHDIKNVSVREQVSEEEWKARVDLAALYRLVTFYGWDDLIFTHISIRVPGPDHHFLINPMGLMWDEITASSLIKIDLEGNKIMPSDFGVNAAGFTIHGAIHMSAPQHVCVIHTHSDDGTAVACQKDGLLPISQHSMQVTADLSYHDYEGIALNHDERPRIISDLGDKHCMILRNHGLMTVGASAADAFLRHFMMERACTMQIRAQAGGADLITPRQEVQDLVAKQGGLTRPNMNAEEFAWAPMLRKLDRLDPSYAE
jgi:ribulose-5-phosphate 4-epimerase/fuculose-1-phosphate aldolase